MPAPLQALLEPMTQAICRGDAEAAGGCFAYSGVCKVRLKGELIERYEEIFGRAQVLARLGFADKRILKSVRKWAGA